MVPSMFQQER